MRVVCDHVEPGEMTRTLNRRNVHKVTLGGRVYGAGALFVRGFECSPGRCIVKVDAFAPSVFVDGGDTYTIQCHDAAEDVDALLARCRVEGSDFNKAAGEDITVGCATFQASDGHTYHFKFGSAFDLMDIRLMLASREDSMPLTSNQRYAIGCRLRDIWRTQYESIG